MGTLLQDLRYGLRQLARNPGFTAVAVLTLALGIGANTAIFSLLNAVLLRNLPVRDPGRLVLFSDNPSESMSINVPDSPSDLNELAGRQTLFSYPLYKDFRDHSRLFEGICAFQAPDDTLTVRRRGETSGEVQVAQGKLVSGNFFSVLGVRTAIGRTLMPTDDDPNAPPVAVVSFIYWQQKLGGDPAIVGRTLDIDRVPTTVVGIAPRGFLGVRMKPEAADLWMPLSLRPRLTLTLMPQAKSLLTDPNIYWLNLMGRLKPGVSVAQARAEIDVALRQYIVGRVGSNMTEAVRQKIRQAYVQLVPGGRGLSEMRHNYSEPLRILLVVVGLVLLIACANVANLLLARATARQKEMAMRLALGGTRGRLMRQILTECLLLVVAGSAAGALIASWGVQVLVALVAAKTPLNVSPDLAVLAFTVGVSALAVIFSGLAPAFRAVRVDLVSALKASPKPGAGHQARMGLGKGLVAFQIAASLLLLVGAGLLAQSLLDLENQDFGFRPEHVLLVTINPELAGYDSQQLPGLYRQLTGRLGGLPGVRSASVGMSSPMSGSRAGFDVAVESQPQPSSREHPQFVAVGPGYFETEGMNIALGRAISPPDTSDSAPVAVVNQAFVRKFVPGGNPIGRRVSMGTPFRPPGMEIVGVAGDAKFSSARDPAEPMLFLSAFQLKSVMTYVNEVEIRAAGNPATVTDEVRRGLHAIDPNLPITHVTTLSAQVHDSLDQQRAISALTGFFGVLGLVLACVGLYGIMAYNVGRKAHEIGICMALGAEKSDVLRMVIGKGLKVAFAGVVIGIIGAIALTRFLSSLLYGVKPTDPLTFVAVSSILIFVALTACYIPARRAAKVDPMTALRYE
ncbi:MAG TPA: ABC transporter permease [Terriglobia bacterium]|nr:ABC transporter permease [Terriglobia bacterium]